MEDALNKLAQYFPSLDRAFLEDVYVSTNKDFDKTVDEFLAMGVDMNVDKKQEQQKKQQYQEPLKPTQPAVVQNHSILSPNVPPPINPHYYTPSSPQVPQHQPQHQQQHQQYQQHQIVNNNNNPSRLSPVTTPPVVSSNYQPPTRMDMYNIPATPPPINSINPSSLSLSSTSPTAPLAVKNDSQMDQKRNETMKQELSLEYQRISEQHKYNLELQQKLDQLSEFTSSEQRKLEEQRNAFNDEKRRFAEELTNKFKALQDDHERQRKQLAEQEEQRIAQTQAEAEDRRQEKEKKRVIKDRLRQEEAVARQQEEERNSVLIADLQSKLAKSLSLNNELQQCTDELAQFKYDAEHKISALEDDNKNLKKQLKDTEYEASSEVLSYFSSVVSSLADGIHSVSMERANKRENESEGEREESPLKDLKKTFFTTINESLNNKLREYDQ